MLKGLPSILSPELLKVLMEMGHGDEIVIADGNFPAASIAQKLIRCDGHGVPPILEAVLTLFPLDIYVEKPATLMAVVYCIRKKGRQIRIISARKATNNERKAYKRK